MSSFVEATEHHIQRCKGMWSDNKFNSLRSQKVFNRQKVVAQLLDAGKCDDAIIEEVSRQFNNGKGTIKHDLRYMHSYKKWFDRATNKLHPCYEPLKRLVDMYDYYVVLGILLAMSHDD